MRLPSGEGGVGGTYALNREKEMMIRFPRTLLLGSS
jgi:hypothetical protein